MVSAQLTVYGRDKIEGKLLIQGKLTKTSHIKLNILHSQVSANMDYKN